MTTISKEFGDEHPTEHHEEAFHMPTEQTKEQTAKIVMGGSAMEGIGGAAALILAILGLVGIAPLYMATIGTICIGAALVFEGAAVASRYRQLAHSIADTRKEKVELGGGTTAEFIGGLAGIVLGILALIGIAPFILMPSAAIVYGGALLLGSASTAELNELSTANVRYHEQAEHIAYGSVMAASGAQVLVGLGAIALGILALLNIAPMTLILVAILALGSSILLSGSALTGKMASVVAHA